MAHNWRLISQRLLASEKVEKFSQVNETVWQIAKERDYAAYY
jgi:hypothetical protein